MNFLRALNNNLMNTKTTNGANALKTTNSGLLDLFGVIGALRNKEDIEIENMFIKAFSEDRLLAMKLLFYSRDIRGGLGERRVARIIYKYLANFYPDCMRKNIKLISHYGRWDDLLVLLDTQLYEDVIMLFEKQLTEDMNSDNPSILAKWMPSINTSSSATRKSATMIMKGLEWDSKKYRQTLSTLRKQIDVVEVKMASKRWEEIRYQTVPSNAMNIYSKAFMKNDEDRFNTYISDVKSGEAKINSSVLYPYNIIEKIMHSGNNADIDVLEQQWNNMPDFINGNDKNVLVMADVSGSMTGRPMATSIGLALYFAQRIGGVFANHFMTFSESPKLVQITGNNLYEQVRLAMGSEWGMNTNFEKALEVILETAVKSNAKQSDMPETLIVVSDMQFDASLRNTNKSWTFYKKMKSRYTSLGFKIPEIVFWNVNSMSNVFQTSKDYEGVKLASGQSTSVFKSILNSKTFSSYDYMLEVLNDERYEDVTV